MPKRFNITGVCIPELHYMVNIEKRIDRIVRDYITNGSYFTINRARQYGKTTTLRALARFLKNEYLVISLDFQMMSHADFENERTFSASFSEELLYRIPDIPQDIRCAPAYILIVIHHQHRQLFQFLRGGQILVLQF